MHLKMWNRSTFLSSIWLHTTTSPSWDPTSFPLFQDWTAAQHRDSGHGKPNILPSRPLYHLVLKRSFIAQLTCFARWGYLAMNSASTFGVEGTRWLQSAKATAQTLLNTFGGAGVGLVLCYCFYGHIIPVGKMVNCTMGSLVSNTAITFLCTATEVIQQSIDVANIRLSSWPGDCHRGYFWISRLLFDVHPGQQA